MLSACLDDDQIIRKMQKRKLNLFLGIWEDFKITIPIQKIKQHPFLIYYSNTTLILLLLVKLTFWALFIWSKLGERYLFFWISKSENQLPQSGVGFAIKTHLTKSLLSLPKKSQWLHVDQEIKYFVSLVTCSVLTIQTQSREIDNFCNQLITLSS